MFEEIKSGQKKLAVVGLGYVGMPIAVSFAENGCDVIGFDLNAKKIEKYKMGIDPTNEVGSERLSKVSMEFTNNPVKLNEASFIIIAVPTPISYDKLPDLGPVIGASEIVGRNLQKDAVIVYESTVYPGVTEDICVPVLEKESKLKCGIDFRIGYSPERINPSDKVHTLSTIKKIVSGMDKETLKIIADVYSIVIKAGVYKASTIKVAEAAKVVENSQRDINIAFMNELSMVFDKMGINTYEVVEAMNTKWNALGFTPGLVGGHCIGVDPYYFIYKAEQLGYHSQIIAAGRKINDGMGKFVAESCIKQMIASDIKIKGAIVTVLGMTFKENCPDVRNSKVMDIILELQEYGVCVQVTDSIADSDELENEYGVKVLKYDDLEKADAVIVAVAHNTYKELDIEKINKLFKNTEKTDNVLLDIKGVYSKKEEIINQFRYWTL